jgi:KUP system potassium uptake protein
MFIKSNQSAATQFHVSAQQHSGEDHNNKFWLLTLGSLGVVYGDIGTSPLSAFREAVVRTAAHGTTPGPFEIYGILSLILWSLTVVVTFKYILFLLYADNRGEGGMLSLTAMAQKGLKSGAGIITFLGIAGAALFYGDASITPAISVLSAVEGLELVAPSMAGYVLPLAIVILVGLFILQKRGTGKVSILFGPVMTIWFVILAVSGLWHIIINPRVLLAFNPYYAVDFLFVHHGIALTVLGAVFLAITGAEALYEDLGHFGRKPIQTAWLFMVFPCLALNYLGQGAMMLADPANAEIRSNPFFLMVPHWALLPLVIAATMATIIASQAVITGTFSLTRSAIQLGLLPRMEIRHTSESHAGQIFMPKVNSLLMWAVLFLIVIFRSSGALASAYGIAVTGTFLVTSALVFIVVWKTWDRSPIFAACLVVPFAIIEGIFLAANMMKLFDGGIVPLLFAAFLIMLMTIWVRGSRYLAVHARRQTIPLTELIETLEAEPPQRIPGTAIFLTGDSQSTPVALIQNLKHNKVLHAQNIILTVVTARIPKVLESQRVFVEKLAPYLTSVVLNYGYMESPDVPRALALAPNLDIDLRDVSYFLGRRTLVSDARRGLPEWQDHIFIPMARSATNATDFFRLPPGKVVELGVQIVI